MIIRVWRGRTSIAQADGYERFLKETAYPDYGRGAGQSRLDTPPASCLGGRRIHVRVVLGFVIQLGNSGNQKLLEAK